MSRDGRDGALTARLHTQCFIIDVSRGGGTVSVSGVGPRATSPLSLSLSLLAEGCAHPPARVGRWGRGKLRLTVNFVVPRVAGVVRNFGASGLTFRSAGNPTATAHPSSANRRHSRDLQSRVRVYVCRVRRVNAWYARLEGSV